MTVQILESVPLMWETQMQSQDASCSLHLHSKPADGQSLCLSLPVTLSFKKKFFFEREITWGRSKLDIYQNSTKKETNT